MTPHLLKPLLDYLADGQRDGVIVDDVEPVVLVGVLRCAGLIVMNRNLFGENYDQVLSATIDAVARGVIRSDGD